MGKEFFPHKSELLFAYFGWCIPLKSVLSNQKRFCPKKMVCFFLVYSGPKATHQVLACAIDDFLLASNLGKEI